MKILCVIDSLNSGGAQRQLIKLAISFKDRGHNVRFLVYHEINFFRELLDSKNIPVDVILENNHLCRLFKMRKFIRKGRFDSVLSFLGSASFIAEFSGLPFRKWRLVVGERSANPNILSSSKLKLFKFFHVFADFVVANSESNLDIIKKVNPLLPKYKYKVIYNIVEASSNPSNYQKDNELTNIVVAASYREVKNLDGLIESVKILPKLYRSRLRISWFGNKNISEPNYKYLENSLKKIFDYRLTNTIFLNDATLNIEKEYAHADFVALFSHFEGFPNTICEAMSLGKPVIVTKVSDVPLFIKDGDNGILCESTDIHSIKNAIIRAIESTSKERNAMGLKNQEIAKKIFNNENNVDLYLKLLKK